MQKPGYSLSGVVKKGTVFPIEGKSKKEKRRKGNIPPNRMGGGGHGVGTVTTIEDGGFGLSAVLDRERQTENAIRGHKKAVRHKTYWGARTKKAAQNSGDGHREDKERKERGGLKKIKD